MKSTTLRTLLSTLVILLLTAGIFLYTAGYRVSKDREAPIDITKTGMVSAKSLPEGANVYLNGELKTATDGTISGITPGNYNLRIIKNGFVMWEKEIEIFPELVTDITAVLISQSPRLEPLTNTGARQPTISPSLTKLAFFSKDGSAPGVWVIPLTGDALSLFRSNPYVVLEDTPGTLFSQGKTIEWSPDEKELLVETEDSQFYTVNLDTGESTFITDSEKIKNEWAEILVQRRIDFIEKLDIPEDLREIAISKDTMWAPDNKKFMYTVENGDVIEYKVYNMEKPIPVGEKVESTVLTWGKDDPQPAISWYADSFHMVVTEMNPEDENRGKVSLIRIDGTNKVEIFNNVLYSNNVYSSSGGDKLVILTSFKSGEQTDLYTIGIR